MFGSVNTPGVSYGDLTRAMEDFKAELFGGELTVPLAATDGTTIATVSGTDILAVKKMTGLTEADVNAAVSMAASGMAAQVRSAEKRAQEYADNAAAQVQADVDAHYSEFQTAMAELDTANETA